MGTLKLHEEESKHGGLAEQNGFWWSNFAHFSEAGKRYRKVVHLPNKSK